jgi:SpoVK/Ycf46/Vps4 family AAA+-type ATPase
MTDLAKLNESSDDDDSDTDPPSTISVELPRALLLAALPTALRRRLDRVDPVAVVVAVPGPDWCDPVCIAVKNLWPGAKLFSRDGSKKLDHKPTIGNDAVAQKLVEGWPVVGISQNPRLYLPSALVSCADAHVMIKAPDAVMLRRLLRSCVGGRVPRHITPGIAGSLAYSEIVAAFRANCLPRDVLANLARTSAAKAKATSTDNTPPLQDLPGYSGEARRWGLDLVAGVETWRRGEIAWKDLPSAAILAGPPGTGKTLFAKAVARSLGLPFVATSVGEWFSTTEGNLGDVAKALQQSWDAAKAVAPSVYFIDELDGLPNRATLTGRGLEWWSPIIGLALTLFDGAVTNSDGIVKIACSNHADKLDAAIIRRFGRIIQVPLPSPTDLAAILRFHAPDLPADADLLPVVRLSAGASAADAARWATEARALARDAGRDMTVADLVAVVAPPDARSPADRRRVAVHEAGHAVLHVALLGDVDSVSIVVAGASGGRTSYGADTLSACPTAEELDAVVVAALGGRAAEEVFCGAPSAGAESDLAAATAIICSQHASAGLGGSLVHLASSDKASMLLLTDAALRRIVEQHVVRLYAQALTLVRERRTAVAAIADALEKHRVLTGEQVKSIMASTSKIATPNRGMRGRP